MQKKLSFYVLTSLAIIGFFSSCSDEDEVVIPMEFANSAYEENPELLLGESINLQPEILNLPAQVSFSWKMNTQTIASEHELNYTPTQAGTFTIDFKAIAQSDTLSRSYQVTVNDPYDLYARPKTENSSAYIAEIIEYKPAPGQYINDTYGTLEEAQKLINSKSAIISLGAWGGYVIFSFDHTIENRENEKDFVVYGNAMSSLSEPGIVQVSFDTNGNGLPDDTWYELAGSAHTAEETLSNYEVTYTNPNEYADVPWADNQENSGEVLVNTYHTQNYYPLFIEEQEQVSFTGTRVYPTINEGNFVSIDPLEWGYVDNYDEDYATYGGNAMELDWAVDAEMNSVSLKGIDFVKVYTAAQGNAGLLGEISTEIKGAADLSMEE